MTTETMRSIEVNGLNLAYTDTGTGDPALVFVHGWTCNHTDWRKQVPEFSGSHRVLTFDQRGHGRSDKPDEDYTIDGFIADLAVFIAATGVEKPVVVGHSMGGAIVLKLSREHPDLVRAAVIVDAPIMPLADAVKPLAESTIAAMKTPAYSTVARQFSSNFMFRDDSDAALKEAILDAMCEAPQRLMWSAIESTLDELNWPPGPVPVPAIFVRAATHLASADEIRGRYPGVEVAEVDAAHFLQLERPDEFNIILTRFLEGLE